MLLDGKRLFITGVLTDKSIAFAVAKIAQQEGAEVVLSGAGRGYRLTKLTAKRLPVEPDVVEMDVNEPAQIEAVRAALESRWGRVDGVLHAIGYAPPACLGGGFVDTEWADVSVAIQTSAYSLAAIARGLRPLLGRGSSILSLDFDARVAWPSYDWMGVAKASLESITRYLARDLGPEGIRVNTLAAGPIRTMAAKSVGGFEKLEEAWSERAPLGWSITDAEPVARMAAVLLSDWSIGVTGELVHVDGGYHAMGA